MSGLWDYVSCHMLLYNDEKYTLFVFMSQVMNVFIIETLKMQTKVKKNLKITICTILQKYFPLTFFYATVKLLLCLNAYLC